MPVAAIPADRARFIMRRAPSGVLVAVLLASGVAAAAAAPSWVPPAPASMVTDRAGVLSPGLRDSLARSLERYQQRSGHQVVVWIDRSTGEVPIEEFAVKAFEAWKIGRAGLDDGLAIFAMTGDRAIRIEVGYELESKITDMVASTVIRNTMIPQIAAGNWDTAMLRGVGYLVDTIEGDVGALPSGLGDGDGGEAGAEAPALGLGSMIGLGLFGLLFVFLLITNPRRALMLLFMIGRSGVGGFGGGGGGGGFRGGGGRSGGGGATGHW